MKKSSLIKIDLIKNLSNKRGYSASFSKKIIADLIEVMINNIKISKLVLKNIGTFMTIKKNERFGRNPKTKEKFIIKARKSISFIASKNLIKNINKYK